MMPHVAMGMCVENGIGQYLHQQRRGCGEVYRGRNSGYSCKIKRAGERDESHGSTPNIHHVVQIAIIAIIVTATQLACKRRQDSERNSTINIVRIALIS